MGSIFGIFSIDNDAVVWSTIDSNKPIKGVITYPVPKDQVTSHTMFHDHESTEIRIVMFSNRTNHSIQYQLFDLSEKNQHSKKGYLNYSRNLINSHTLYTAPIKKNN